MREFIKKFKSHDFNSNILPQKGEFTPSHLSAMRTEAWQYYTVQMSHCANTKVQRWNKLGSRTRRCIEIFRSVQKLSSKVRASDSLSSGQSGKRRSLEFIETFPTAFHVSSVVYVTVYNRAVNVRLIL